jgi:hypothetical protein
MPDEESSQAYEDEEDAGIMEERGPRVEDLVGLAKYHSTPTKLKDSNYHVFLAKEMAIGFLENREDVRLVERKFKLITLFTFLNLPVIAKIYDAEMLVKINTMRSIGGKERLAQTTISHSISKTINEPPKRGLLG